MAPTSLGRAHPDAVQRRGGRKWIVARDGSEQSHAAQMALLEARIDARAGETIPFAILGDFNRAFVHVQNDHFWQEIDDGDPPGLDLRRLPFRQESDCWRGTSRHADSIDFLDFDARAWQSVIEASFKQMTYYPS